MKLLELQGKLSKLSVFTPSELRRYTGISAAAAHKLLWRYTKMGIFVRLRNGLYFFKRDAQPPLWHVANKIYQPSYVSFESALSYYGVIPESVYSVISATSKITRKFISLNREFVYRKIKNSAFTGYKPVKISNMTVFVAETEKALADYLYFVYLKKLPMNDRLNLRRVKVNILKKYISLFNDTYFNRWSRSVIRKHD